MWHNWDISRVIVLSSGLALLLIFYQVTLLHYRQNFRHWAMWLPVLGTPAIGLLVTLLAVTASPALKAITTIFLVVGALAGLIGFYFHYVGVGNRVGGYQMQNFLVGPPIILPLMVTTLSVFGLIGIYWR